MVLTTHPARGFARGLHGRQQQGYQNADDRNDDQKLDQGEAGKRPAAMWEHGRNLPVWEHRPS
jgi:hypothetical protein